MNRIVRGIAVGVGVFLATFVVGWWFGLSVGLAKHEPIDWLSVLGNTMVLAPMFGGGATFMYWTWPGD